MKVLFQENAYDSNAFNVFVNGEQVDRVEMNYKQRYTQAHISLAQAAIKNGIEISDIDVQIECTENSVSFPYPKEELLEMAQIWKSVREYNLARRA